MKRPRLAEMSPRTSERPVSPLMRAKENRKMPKYSGGPISSATDAIALIRKMTTMSLDVSPMNEE